MAKVSLNEARQLAGPELNALAVTKVIPIEEIGGARVGARGTTIFDLNGEPLFYRVPLYKGRGQAGYTDLAADQSLGEPLMATTYGAVWDEQTIKKIEFVLWLTVTQKLQYNS